MRWLLAALFALVVSQASAQQGSTLSALPNISTPLTATDLIYIDAGSGSCDGFGNCNATAVQMMHVTASPTISGSSFSAANSGMFLTTTLAGTATSSTTEIVAGGYIQPKNIITCTIDTVTANAISGNIVDVPCFEIVNNVGGVSGARAGLRVDTNVSNFIGPASGGTPDINAGGTAALFTMQGNFNLGGNVSTPRGSGGAVGIQLVITPNGSYYFSHVGLEDDTSSQPGSHPFNKAGILIAAFNNDNDHASCQSAGNNNCAIDAGIAITAVGICTASGVPAADCTQYGGWNQGLLFAGNNYGNQFPVPTGGTLIVSDASTVLRGVDFTLVTFSGGGNCAFCSNNFSINGSGDQEFSGNLTTGNANLSVNYGGSGTMFQVANPATTSLANYVVVSSSAAAGTPSIGLAGTDASINLALNGKSATGLVELAAQNADYLTVAGSASSGVTLNTSGGLLVVTPETVFVATIVLESAIQTFGQDQLVFNDGGNGQMFALQAVSGGGAPGAGIADSLVIFGAIAASPATVGISAAGSDTIINIGINSKGATGATVFNSRINIPIATWTDNQTCAAGDFEVDASFIYVCTSSSTVKRATLSSF